MRYLLIDHITEWKAGEFIKGVKNVAMSEDFLEFHFPKNPIMPGVLLLEALTQLTGWLEAASSDFRNWFLINRVIKSNFYSFALPGDQVELEVRRIEGENADFKIYRGTGLVNGKKKIVAEFEGIAAPLDEIENTEEQRRFFQVLTRGLKL
ncbi:MAG: beta-hydroxyacyl-ACP dehydratase [Nitrospiraceae bacterium]|nr:MAG: beta-hydroxyacyl-ACP dehydratase [Nitrospiraceae bacterium]